MILFIVNYANEIVDKLLILQNLTKRVTIVQNVFKLTKLTFNFKIVLHNYIFLVL